MDTAKMKHAALAMALGAAVSLPFGAYAQDADSVVEQIEAGLSFYQEQSYSDAINELQFAINEIRGLLVGELAATFPEPAEGWEAKDVESEGGGAAAFLGGGLMLNRNYRQADTNGNIDVQLIADSPMIQGFAAMASNPALLASQPNAERIRVGRENAIVSYDPDRRRGELTFVSGGRVMIKFEARNIDNSDALKALFKAWDLKALKYILAL